MQQADLPLTCEARRDTQTPSVASHYTVDPGNPNVLIIARGVPWDWLASVARKMRN